MSTLGEEAAARCRECGRARDAGYVGVTGWLIGNGGQRHNHLRGTQAATNTTPDTKPAPEPQPVSADPRLELTVEEGKMADQLGVPRDAVLSQKLRDIIYGTYEGA